MATLFTNEPWQTDVFKISLRSAPLIPTNISAVYILLTTPKELILKVTCLGEMSTEGLPVYLYLSRLVGEGVMGDE